MAQKPRELTKAEKLARAVLLIHSGSQWTKDKQQLWKEYTGSDEATFKVLCDVARAFLSEEQTKSGTKSGR